MKERYFIAELILTFAILYLAICQFAALAFYRLYLFAGLSCGCLFSYFLRKKHFNLAGLINIGIIPLAVWTFYSLLRSSLSHREIILILIKGLVIFEILLSFNAHLNLYLNYIQALSIPLFMSQIVFMKGYDEIYALVSLAYLVCWLSLLRLKFYRLFWSPEAEINPSRQHYSIFLSIAVFIASIFLSGLLFYRFPLKEIAKIGFLQEFSKGMEMEPENIGQEYYDLLDKLQVEMTRLISSLSSREERERGLFLLSHVVKDWPYSMEVDRAQQGLISLLKIPGPGLEKGSTQELTIFNNYLDKKSAFISHRIKKNITDAFKNKPFNIKERITVSDKINKVQHANNQHEIRRYAKELAKIIDKAALETKVKNELKDMSRQLMDWRFFEVYRWRIESAREALATLASHQDKLSELFLGVSNTQDLGQAQELMSKIENEKISLAPQSDYRDFINNLKEALDLKIEMLVADESIRLKDKIGAPDLTEDKRRKLQNALDDIEATQNYEELLVFQENIKNEQPDLYQDIEELLEADNYLIVSEEEKNLADLKEEQRQKDEVLKQRDLHRIKYKAIIRGALSLLPGLTVFLLLSLILSFFVLCFITERRRRRIICLYQNPREFIIGLYENLKYILGLLGLGYNKTSAPLAYAHMVEERYELKDNLVLKLTAKFEEAKYSKHNLGANDASSVLRDYNSFLKILFKNHSKIFVFFKYLILLLYTRPVFIARNLR